MKQCRPILRRDVAFLRVSTLAALLAAGAAAVGGVVVGCQRSGDSTHSTAAPATAPQPTDWSAFSGGGGLLGQAVLIGPPPYKLRWTYVASEDGTPIDGGAAIVDDTAYVGDGAGFVHAINLATGKARWKSKLESPFETTPLVTAGMVILGDTAGKMHALDAATGRPLWEYDSGTGIHAAANLLPTADGARIVFATDGARVVCVSMQGKELWSAEAEDRVNSCPAVADGMVYAAGCDAQLRALNAADGSLKWARDLPSLAPGSAAVTDDRIIVGTDGGHVVCWLRHGHTQLWQYDNIEDESMVYASPAVADGIVVVGARDRQVHAIDADTGERRWVFKTRGDVDSTAVISGGRVYVASKDKRLYVLDLQTGKELWQFTAERPITAPVSIGRGVIVVSDSDGLVYCLEPK